MRTSLALAAAGLLLVAAPALASARDERPSRGSAVPAPSFVPVPIPAPLPPAGGVSYSHSSGSITSFNTVSTDSGGNSGSHVVTGDQSSSVTVLNIGSSGSGTATVVATPSPQSASGPQCADRTCPRTR